MVESTDTSQSISPAASALAWAAWSIRSNVPSAAQRRKRVWRLVHGPYRSGTSRQGTPVRNFHTIPLRTIRSSSRGRPSAGPGQQRAYEVPLGIGQFMATYHHPMIHYPRSL